MALAMALLVRVGQATRSAEKLLELQAAMAAKDTKGTVSQGRAERGDASGDVYDVYGGSVRF